MAGSVASFRYVTDKGLIFGIDADKSNVLSVNTTIPALAPGTEVLPVAKKCRAAIYRSPDKLYTRVVPVLSTALLATVPNTLAIVTTSGDPQNPSGTAVLELKSIRKERFKLSGADSGLTV